MMSSSLSPDSSSIKIITKWNSILRECGYTGFADKSGRGYIHESEPYQACFLSTKSFDVIELVLNKDYSGVSNQVTSIAQMNNKIENDINLVFPYMLFLARKEPPTQFDVKIFDTIKGKHHVMIDEVSYEDIHKLFEKCLIYAKHFSLSLYETADFTTAVKVVKSKYHVAHDVYHSDLNNLVKEIEKVLAEKLS